MKLTKLTVVIAITLVGVLAIPACAEVLYTPVFISVPVGGKYYIDLNHDGVTDFTLKSHLLEDYCQYGDGYIWTLSLTTSAGNAVMVSTEDYAAALTMGQPVESSQDFYQGMSTMTRLSWGYCGYGNLGEWLNLHDHYLAFQLRGSGISDVHYGWARLSNVAYVDLYGHLHASVILSDFAYETIPGKRLLTGQTSD